jgi:integral membrane sensor domain MASE1
MRRHAHDWPTRLSGVVANADDSFPLVHNSSLKHLANQLLLVSAYIVAGKIGLTLALLNSSATAVWPPTGIALAAFQACGQRNVA